MMNHFQKLWLILPPRVAVSRYIYVLKMQNVYEAVCLSGGVQSFSRLHPLACWFGSMMLCFAGGILGNFLLGEPLLAPFQSEKEVLTATVVW